MAMKEYSTFPKVPALLESHHQIVYYHNPGLSSAQKQVVYSTAPIDWAAYFYIKLLVYRMYLPLSYIADRL